ncbi:unnamed protein product [Trifolium pratense]|uniref:Uncharacterized protein n=1 Tax=Trifolium pratense TaxID=57577 RepID=A0ACB0JKF6_TRIPR|nr:unnamed protein product [Trifolium pratense]
MLLRLCLSLFFFFVLAINSFVLWIATELSHRCQGRHSLGLIDASVKFICLFRNCCFGCWLTTGRRRVLHKWRGCVNSYISKTVELQLRRIKI